MMRVTVESPCEKCGNTHVGERIIDVGCFGSGGSRRVLTPGEFLLIEGDRTQRIVGALEWLIAECGIHWLTEKVNHRKRADVLAVGEGS